MRDLQRESRSSLPTTHSEKQGRRKKRRKEEEEEKKKSSGKVPVTFPSASSHHPSGVIPYIYFHFYILLPSPSPLVPPLSSLLSSSDTASLPLSLLLHLHFSSTLRVVHAAGVCASACLITTTLALLQTLQYSTLLQELLGGCLTSQHTLYLFIFFFFAILHSSTSHSPSVSVSL